MSYAVHPDRSVALKNGDCRYHGPKYSVALLASISSRSLTIRHASRSAPGRAYTRRSRLKHDSRDRPIASRPARLSSADRLNDRSGNRDLLRGIDERHRRHGSRPPPPLGLDRYPLTFIAAIRRQPAVADVPLQARRVDRRGDLADQFAVDRGGPLHGV